MLKTIMGMANLCDGGLIVVRVSERNTDWDRTGIDPIESAGSMDTPPQIPLIGQKSLVEKLISDGEAFSATLQQFLTALRQSAN